jgi:ABC-type transport system substrate-binding protein
LGKVDVRRAAQYAIDTVALAKAQGYGWATGYWNQVFPKGNPAYDPTIVGYPYNPAKAKELLAKAGYPNGFKTSLYVTVPPVGDLEPAVQNYLMQVGINAEMKPLPGASYARPNQGWQNGLFKSIRQLWRRSVTDAGPMTLPQGRPGVAGLGLTG